MDFKLLTSNSRQLLNEMVSAPTSATVLVCDKLKAASSDEKEEIKGMLKELKDKKYIEIYWASNEPYLITINNEGKNYEKLYAEYESKKELGRVSISIGDNNKIKNSTIANTIEGEVEKKGFYAKHPVFCTVIISLAVGFVLLFSFWKDLVSLIENIFK